METDDVARRNIRVTLAAIHEAAHVVVAIHLGFGLVEASIRRHRGQWTGRTTFIDPPRQRGNAESLVGLAGGITEALHRSADVCKSNVWIRCSDTDLANVQWEDLAEAEALVRELWTEIRDTALRLQGTFSLVLIDGREIWLEGHP